MSGSKLIAVVALGLVLATVPAQAQVWYGPGYIRGFPGDTWFGPLGYPSMSLEAIPRTPEVRPTSGVPMIRGAVSYIDEGDYRNYRDADGEFLGRVLLRDIPDGRW